MVGHGCPRTSRARSVFARWPRVAIACVLLSLARVAGGVDSTVRVRVMWGGGAPQAWHGHAELSDGSLTELRLLGTVADVPGSIWIDGRRVEVRAAGPRTYDGFEITVASPKEAVLRVELAGVESTPRSVSLDVPIARLLSDTAPLSVALDELGSQLQVRRPSADKLRVRLARKSLVFSPGERFDVEIEPYELGASADGRILIQVQLHELVSSRLVWSGEYEWTEASAPLVAPIAIGISLPRVEGVYDLSISAVPLRLRSRLGLSHRLAERAVQLVVVDRAAPPLEATNVAAHENTLVEIDPAAARWWDRLAKLPLVPGMRRDSLSSGDSHPWRHALGDMIQLDPPASREEIPWAAYPLPITQPSQPHMLELTYPSDVRQSLGISIVEPNAAGAVVPIGLDSGVYVPDDAAATAPQWATHQLIFWPRTTSPVAVLTNRAIDQRAVFGKIRVSSMGEKLPRQFASPAVTSERLILGYLARPLLAENTGAPEALDPDSGRSLDDWRTYLIAANRLAEYLHWAGYNGVVMSVVADGAAVYPSELLDSTPRHDSGVFFETGQDPVAKDVLELILRVFDRQGLKLIPAVNFDTRLPALEEIRRRDAAEAQSLEWIGPDGATWLDRHEPQGGLAPYYNVLHPAVQKAMRDVVLELFARYAGHPSLAGLAIPMSAYGYAQLPGTEWGLDDETMAHFTRETGIEIPGGGPQRFAVRAELSRGMHRGTWLAWRAEKLREFYGGIERELSSVRPGTKVYLLPTETLESPEAQAQLRPTLPRKTKGALDEAMLAAGIDPAAFAETGRIVLLRPQRIAPPGEIAERAVDLEVNDAAELDRALQSAPQRGSVFFHPPQTTRLASFDAKSPFQTTTTWMVSQLSPAGALNRRRFVHSLATLDPHIMVDGGWLLPLGQEAALRPLVAVYRRLPLADFKPLAEETQPVVIRTARHEGRSFVYLANDSPWKTTVSLEVSAPAGCRAESLRPDSAPPPEVGGTPTPWTIELEPYDLAGAAFSSPNVKFGVPAITIDPAVATELELRIRELGARANALASPPTLDALSNPGFEAPLAASNDVRGWQLDPPQGASLRLDTANPHSGGRSLAISCDVQGASLASDPIEVPASGRLTLWVWLRVDDTSPSPPLRLAIEGKWKDRQYYRPSLEFGPNDLKEGWWQFYFPIEDLPLERLAELRVKVEVLGAGTVWVDDVSLSHLRFSEVELAELKKIITLANVKLEAGKLSDCQRLLEGYWPRFLMANVSVAPGRVARIPSAAPSAAESSGAAPDESPSTLDRLKRFVPKFLRY